jgi:hypothetical protein
MVRVRRGSLVLLTTCLGLVAATGCATAGSTAGNFVGHVASVTPQPVLPTPSPGSSPQGVNVAAFDALARQEASAWAGSPLAKVWGTGLVLLPGDDLSPGPSGGFPSAETKEAFGNGDLVFTGPAPSGAPDGVVTWPDGSTMKVPVLSEAQAFNAMKTNNGGKCPSCLTTPLDVTAAKPATLLVGTSRGTAAVPAWAFTLQGVSTPAIQAALPPGSYVTPDSYGAPAEKVGPLGKSFVGVGNATPSADGRTLTLTLFGGECNTSWGGLVAEFGGAVVVGGWLFDSHPDQACSAVGVLTKVTVHLAKPLGDRVILDAVSGQPVTPITPVPEQTPS